MLLSGRFDLGRTRSDLRQEPRCDHQGACLVADSASRPARTPPACCLVALTHNRFSLWSQLQHHFVAIAYLSAPIFWPEYRWFMGACLSVEINTWFLIARRVVYKRRDQMPAFVQDVVSQLFYLSWIVIRMYVYPLIMYIFCRMAYEEIVKTGVFWHWPMMFMPVHFFLCVLNLKWSYDLFKPIILRWFGSRKEETGVASGL